MRGMELKNEIEEARNYIFYVSDYIDVSAGHAWKMDCRQAMTSKLQGDEIYRISWRMSGCRQCGNFVPIEDVGDFPCGICIFTESAGVCVDLCVCSRDGRGLICRSKWNRKCTDGDTWTVSGYL